MDNFMPLPRRSPLKKTPHKDSVSPADLYKIALDTRNLEINLFWQRCNYFLVLNSAAALGYLKVDDGPVQIGTTLLGMIICYLWYRVALGSKYWQERWESCLHRVEKKLIAERKFPSEIPLFSPPWQMVREEVQNSLANANHGPLGQFIDQKILTKPSVTQAMFCLVWIFMACWLFLFLHHTGTFNYFLELFTI